MMHYHIIVPHNLRDPIFQDGTIYCIVILIFQGIMFHVYNHQNILIVYFLLILIKLTSIYLKYIQIFDTRINTI